MAAPGNPDIGNHAAKGGRNRARRQMTMARWDEVLTPLVTPEDCLKRAELVQRLCLDGRITTAQSSSAIRACDTWLKGWTAHQSSETIKRLEAEVETLTAELTRHRAMKVVG